MSSGAITCPIRCHIRQLTKRLWLWESTNLNLCKDWEKDIHNEASSDWNIGIRSRVVYDRGQSSDDQQRAHGENGTRLDEHGGDSLVQSTISSLRPGGTADVPPVQDDPDDDHQGKEDVERNRD